MSTFRFNNIDSDGKFTFGSSSATGSSSSSSSSLSSNPSSAAASGFFFGSTVSNLASSPPPGFETAASSSRSLQFGSSSNPPGSSSSSASSSKPSRFTVTYDSFSVPGSTPSPFVGSSPSIASSSSGRSASKPSRFTVTYDSATTTNPTPFSSSCSGSLQFGSSSNAPVSSPSPFVGSSSSGGSASKPSRFTVTYDSTPFSGSCSSSLQFGSSSSNAPVSSPFGFVTSSSSQPDTSSAFAPSQTISASNTYAPVFSFVTTATSSSTPANSGFQSSFGFNFSTTSSAPASNTFAPVFPFVTSATSAPAASATVFPSFGMVPFAANTTQASSTATFRPTRFGPGATGSTLASSSQPQTTNAPLSFSFPCSTAATTSLVVAPSSGTITTFGAPVVGSLPSEITGKTVEEIINGWNSELQERTERFQKQANAISEWDKLILQNRDVLLRLETEVARVVQTHSSLDRQLELIETHQLEVDKALESIEEEAERIYNNERKTLLEDEAMSTRDKLYEESEVGERELQHMTEQIRSIIQSVNANQGGGELEAVDGMSTLDIVVKILNNQLSSLMLIDEKAEEFSSRIQKLESQRSGSEQESMDPKHWMS